MAVDFPSSPSNGQKLSAADALHVYDSSKGYWKSTPTTSGIQLASLGVTAPADASGSGGLSYNNTTGDFTYTPPVLSAGFGATVYATAADLPLSGNTAGDQAYVTATNRLYLWTGTGWHNIALINTSPTITTGGAATYELATDGTATVITLAATDPEEVPITWSHSVTAGSLGSTATVSQSDNVFTITPSTDSANAGTFSLTFTASDGVNIATSTSAFTLAFGSPILAGNLLTTIYNPNPSSTDNFADRGNLMNDDYYVIGSWASSAANSKVQLFNRSNGNLAYTITNTPSSANRFGYHGAISGNYLLLGDISGSAIYLYDISTFSSSTITSANYTLSDPNYNSLGGSHFASSGDRCAISGNYIAISNYSSSVGGTVYVYDISTFSSSTITSANYNLTNPNKYGSSSSSDKFGLSVAVDGNILVVGSREESSGGSSNDGVVYVYDISNFSSSVISSADFSIDNPDYGSSNDGDDRHGDKVAVSQDYIVVGAMYNDEPFYTAGTIYIYDTSNGNLLYTVASPSSSTVSNQWFGYSLALDGNNLYGQVYASATWTIYHYDISSFTSSTPAVIAAGTGIENTLSAPISSTDWGGGANWWAHDGKLIVGAGGVDDTNGSGGTLTDSGVAYVYE